MNRGTSDRDDESGIALAWEIGRQVPSRAAGKTGVNAIGAEEDGHYADGYNEFWIDAPARDAGNDSQGT